MKKLIMSSIFVVMSICLVTNIYSGSGDCFNQWSEMASISSCNIGISSIDCDKPYLAGEHNCCPSGTTFLECPEGNAYTTFITWKGGSCINLPGCGFAHNYCAGGYPFGELEPLHGVWVPNDIGQGICNWQEH